MRTALQHFVAPLALTVALLGLTLVGACTASAQPRPGSGQARGLALDRVIAETGLSLDEIVVPSDPRSPVRLELRDLQSLAVLLDVRVLGDAREARERIVSIEPSLSSHGVSSLSGVGDAAYVDDAATVLALARGNVLVVVRAVPRDEASIDVRAVAAAIVRACDGSPRLDGEGAVRTIDPSIVPALQSGTATIAIPAGFVAMRVDVEGEGLARRVDDTHWQIERVRDRADVRVVAVDALLRVAR